MVRAHPASPSKELKQEAKNRAKVVRGGSDGGSMACTYCGSAGLVGAAYHRASGALGEPDEVHAFIFPSVDYMLAAWLKFPEVRSGEWRWQCTTHDFLYVKAAEPLASYRETKETG